MSCSVHKDVQVLESVFKEKDVLFLLPNRWSRTGGVETTKSS